jgi:4-amino-4-deoxychorismate lyase
MTRWLVNGRPDGLVPADDRGVLYGDGLFETIRFHRGRAPLWALHMDRLRRGCRLLDLPQPDAALLEAECREVAMHEGDCAVRITWTRGRGGRAYVPPANADPTRIVMRRELPADLDHQQARGIELVSVQMDLPVFGPLNGLKHLNRLPQVLLGAHCARVGVHEALVVDGQGRWIEALTGNLVVERDGRLLEPEPHPAAVTGVGLSWLRGVAGHRLERIEFRSGDLRSDDAIWVLNSVLGIRPVAQLDGQKRTTGSTLAAWQAKWRDAVESENLS